MCVITGCKHTERQQPGECLHFLAAGLIMKECEDMLVLAEQGLGSFLVKKPDLMKRRQDSSLFQGHCWESCGSFVAFYKQIKV